ncbi:hypothetical protein [Halothiobacillus sp. DCM-1]
MMAMIENNPAMIALVVCVVLIAVALHIALFFFVRRVLRAGTQPARDD